MKPQPIVPDSAVNRRLLENLRQARLDFAEVDLQVSLDEFAIRKGKGNFATILTDLDTSSLLEVIDSHKSEDIITVLKQQPLEMREGVEEVCVDMWAGFPKVIREVFPNAETAYHHISGRADVFCSICNRI